MKILVADDEQNICYGLQQYIQSLDNDWSVSAIARNGEEVLNIVNSLNIDVILLDINMPLLSGVDVMNQLKKQDNFPLVIIITAHSEFSVAKEAIHFGVLDYILKPVNLTELNNCLVRAAKIVEEKKSSSDLYQLPATSNDFHTLTKPVQYAIMFICENYDKNLSLNELAKASYVNPVYLSTLFKKEVGITISSYILQYRVEIAKTLLSKTQNSISTISYQVGYNDQHYFSNVFKKTTGSSPSKYRRTKI